MKIIKVFMKFISSGKEIPGKEIPCPACGGQTILCCALCGGKGYVFQPKVDDKQIEVNHEK